MVAVKAREEHTGGGGGNDDVVWCRSRSDLGVTTTTTAMRVVHSLMAVVEVVALSDE